VSNELKSIIVLLEAMIVNVTDPKKRFIVLQ